MHGQRVSVWDGRAFPQDATRMAFLLVQGCCWSAIARELGIGKITVMRAFSKPVQILDPDRNQLSARNTTETWSQSWFPAEENRIRLVPTRGGTSHDLL
jgi:hypothetical protein